MIHWSSFPPAVFGETGRQMSPNELVQRGKELRNEIDSVYQTLKTEKKLSGRGTDISDHVRKYIPPGSSFDDAEEILRSAGFSVLAGRQAIRQVTGRTATMFLRS